MLIKGGRVLGIKKVEDWEEYKIKIIMMVSWGEINICTIVIINSTMSFFIIYYLCISVIITKHKLKLLAFDLISIFSCKKLPCTIAAYSLNI